VTNNTESVIGKVNFVSRHCTFLSTSIRPSHTTL